MTSSAYEFTHEDRINIEDAPLNIVNSKYSIGKQIVPNIHGSSLNMSRKIK